MDEIIKTVLATGGSVTTILLIYYVWKIEPRLRSLEITILQGLQVDLLRLTRQGALSPDLHESAMTMLKNTNDKVEELKSEKDV